MALNNFIPSVWAARLLDNLRKNLVYAQDGVVNRDYEGEIRDAGDSVRINAIGPVTVATYTKNTDINPPEVLQDAQTVLVIDQAKYFNFAVDDVDRVQQRPQLMDAAMAEAAYALRDDLDQYVAGLYTQIAVSNMLGSDTSPITPTATTAYELLVDLGVMLDDAKVPRANRFVVVPPWYHGLLLKDDRFVRAGTPTTDQVIRNGEVGQAAGFRVLISHNVPNTLGTKYKIIAGHPMAWSVAEQINKVEAYRPERRFADAVKGLHLYGAKVLRPTALALLTANKS